MARISQVNQTNRWDTTTVSGPFRNNGLETRSGHTSDNKANENPGATAIATGAKDVVEGVYLSTNHRAVLFCLAMPLRRACKITVLAVENGGFKNATADGSAPCDLCQLMGVTA